MSGVTYFIDWLGRCAALLQCTGWSFLGTFAVCGSRSLLSALLSHSHISHLTLTYFSHLTNKLYSSQASANAMFTVKPHYVNVFTFSHDFVFCMTYQNCRPTTATAQSASSLLPDSSQSFMKLLLEATGFSSRDRKVGPRHDGLVELNGDERVWCWCLYNSYKSC